MSGFRTPDIVTYWLEGTKDGKGNQSWSDPVTLASFIALKSKEITDLEGNLVITSHAIYARTLLPTGTYIAIGDQTASAIPTDSSTAKKVVMSSNTSSMSDMSRMLI